MYVIDSWYAVLDSREVRRGKPHAARRFGRELVFWRDADGAVQCVSDRCPHRGAALSGGRVRDGCIECPFHGFRFDGAGACVKVPCNGPEDQRPKHLATQAYPVREAHGFVWLWWGEARPAGDYPPVPWFDRLEGYAYSGFVEDTKVDWTRNVENQLDWAHLPFVHKTTIGGSFPHEIEVRSKVEGDHLTTWLAHQEDEQGKPSFYLRFAFPNIWYNPFFGNLMIGFVAFVPIDEAHSRLHFRTYARLPILPALSRLAARIVDLFNRVIVRQDLRVIQTQPTGSHEAHRQERLVQSDLAIAHFRRELTRRSQSPIKINRQPPSNLAS